MVELIIPNSEKFTKAVGKLEIQTAGMLANILEKTSHPIDYKTVYNSEKNSRTILFFFENQKISISDIPILYNIISEEDIQEFFPSQLRVPKPAAIIDIHEIHPDIVVLDGIEVDSSLKGQGVGDAMLSQLENIIHQEGYTYILSAHYHQDSRGFFEQRGFIRATESNVAFYPEVQTYTSTEDPKDKDRCVILIKKL